MVRSMKEQFYRAQKKLNAERNLKETFEQPHLLWSEAGAWDLESRVHIVTMVHHTCTHVRINTHTHLIVDVLDVLQGGGKERTQALGFTLRI